MVAVSSCRPMDQSLQIRHGKLNTAGLYIRLGITNCWQPRKRSEKEVRVRFDCVHRPLRETKGMYGTYSVTLAQRSDIQEGQASIEKDMNIQRQDSFSLLHGVGALNLFSLLVFCISVMDEWPVSM